MDDPVYVVVVNVQWRLNGVRQILRFPVSEIIRNGIVTRKSVPKNMLSNPAKWTLIACTCGCTITSKVTQLPINERKTVRNRGSVRTYVPPAQCALGLHSSSFLALLGYIMDSPNQQASSNGFSPNSDLVAEYDTSNLETAWSFAERGGLFDLDDADGARCVISSFST